MALSREAILARAKPGVEEIGPVPGWDDTVFIRHITVGERNTWAALQYDALKGDTLDFGRMVESRVHLVAASLCDEKGESLFSLDEVRGLDPNAVDYIAGAAERLNGLTEEAMEEVKGNSNAPQDADDSTS